MRQVVPLPRQNMQERTESSLSSDQLSGVSFQPSPSLSRPVSVRHNLLLVFSLFCTCSVCFVWVRNLVADNAGGKEAEGV